MDAHETQDPQADPQPASKINLPPKFQALLTPEQTATLDQLQRALDASIAAAKAIPASHPAPGQLQSQREVDGAQHLAKRLDEFHAGLALAEETERALYAQWARGAIPPADKNAYAKARRVAETQTALWLRRITALNNHRSEMLGLMADDARLLLVDHPGDDWAYVDGLLRAYRHGYAHGESNSMSRSMMLLSMSAFRKKLVDRYDALRSPERRQTSGVWCPVSRIFFRHASTVAVHII